MTISRPVDAAELGLTRGVGFELAGELAPPPRLAIVGARAALHALAARVPALVAAAAGHGFSLVSGGAIGIDAAMHRAALDQRVAQLAVLPCGSDKPYPPVHGELFAAIAEAPGSGVLFARPRGSVPTRGGFVSRNAIVIALADACVVVQAGARSGSETTGRLALRAGKRLAALPSSPGCAALVGAGAVPLHGDDDAALTEAFAAWLDGAPIARIWPEHLRSLGERLHAAGPRGTTLDALGGPMAAIVLFEAEVLGLASEVSPGRWIAIA